MLLNFITCYDFLNFSHPFPSQKGVIRGLLRGDYGVIRGIFSVRCYEENIPLGVNLLSADSPPF